MTVTNSERSSRDAPEAVSERITYQLGVLDVEILT